MPIVQRVSGTASYFSASPITVSKPAAVQAYDVAIVCGASNSVAWNTPSGWTAITLNATYAGLYLSVWYRIIQAGDTAWNFSTQSSNNCGIVFVAFSGVDRTTQIDATGATSTASGSAITANSVTIATDGSFWMNAIGGVQTGSNPQFSASGFNEYDNGSVATSLPAGLLWQGPMAPGATGTSSIAASFGQYMISVPFALRPLAPIMLGVTAVKASQTTGVTGEKSIVVNPAIRASIAAPFGEYKRQLENVNRRLLEDGSLRLLEGPIVSPVSIVIVKPSPAITGFVGVGSISQLPVTTNVSAVVTVAYTEQTVERIIFAPVAVSAVGYPSIVGATDLIPAVATITTGYVSATNVARAINALAVSGVWSLGASTLTIGGGAYISADAASATGYVGIIIATELIGCVTVAATGYCGVVALAVAGALMVDVNATAMTGLTGIDVVNETMATEPVSTQAIVSPPTIGLTSIAGAVSVLSLTGMGTSLIRTSQPATGTAGFALGATIASSIIAMGAISASWSTGVPSGFPFPALLAVGCTSFAGGVVETVTARCPAATSIWFPANVMVIQIFNVSAPAVLASAFPGVTPVQIIVSSPAAFAVEWSAPALAIPAPPLDAARVITTQVPVDQYGVVGKIKPVTNDALGTPAITMPKPADQFGETGEVKSISQDAFGNSVITVQNPIDQFGGHSVIVSRN